MKSDQIHSLASRIVELLDPCGELIGTWPLVGGVSAQVFGIEYGTGSGAPRRVVVRQHGHRDIARNPDIARDEFRLLKFLHEQGLAVPKSVLLDESQQVLASPYLVQEYIDGETNPGDIALGAMIDQIARQLADIHHAYWQRMGGVSLPDQDKAYHRRVQHRPDEVAREMHEEVARAAMEQKGRLARLNRPVLLHGDFWPGNLLWRAGRIASVIDWEDAAIGDPLSDLANCRMELLFAYGVVAMDEFTRRYAEIALIDLGELPYWDLFAATGPVLRLREWGLSPDAEKSMIERHGAFVRQALQRIAATSIPSCGRQRTMGSTALS